MSENRKTEPLQPVDHGEEVALFRSQIIGPLLRREFTHGQLSVLLRDLSAQRYRPPGRPVTRTFSAVTLERWYYAYKRGGLAALVPQKRTDAGHAQELTDAQRTLLCDIRKEHPSASASLIVRTLVADGRLDEGAVSEATVRRLFVERGLDRVALRTGATSTTTRLRWQTERPGALWHGDVCHGPTLQIDGKPRALRIHALLDDNSRYLIAIQAHHTEREVDMLGLFLRALRRHGAPDALYLDNGSTYRGDALRLACERLGITLLHARPYDAPARGKMERFWRTLRDGCLDFLGPVASLDDVHQKLHAFVEVHYHKAPHASLMGKAPGLVYAQGRTGHIDTLTEDKLRSALTVRHNRRVRNDTTLSLGSVDWELDQGFLAGRIVVVAQNLSDPNEPPWVEYQGQRLALRPVDPIHNARRKRPQKKTATAAPPSTPVPFDPAGALQLRTRSDDDSNTPSDEELF